MKYHRIQFTSVSVITCTKKAVTYVMAFLLSAGLLVLPLQKALGEEATAAKEKNIAAEVKETAKEKSHKVYFSLVDEFGGPKKEPKQSFDCTDQIFTVAELSNYPRGAYQLTVLWKDPIDSVREKTSYAFNVHNKETRIWAWLTLSRATGAGLIQWIDPAAGLESFIGEWTIEVLINDQRISKQNIEVSC